MVILKSKDEGVLPSPPCPPNIYFLFSFEENLNCYLTLSPPPPGGRSEQLTNDPSQLYPTVTSSSRHLAKGTVKPLKFKEEKILNGGILYI